jgi:ComF family protein
MAAAPLCRGCRERLFPEPEKACERCGFPSVPGASTTRERGCPHCATKRFRFERALALGVYRGGLQTALLRMKHFRGHRLAAAVGRQMGICLADRFEACCPDVVIPIPARRWRRMTTGSASPAILARRIARQLRIPVLPEALRWQRNIQRQHTLLPTERKRNVHGALAVTRGYRIGVAHVLLVDDILTTGATANEATRVLLKAGASRVTVAIVARVADR